TTHASSADLLTLLPASDVVLTVDHSRIWNEAIPRIFGQDFTPLKKLMAEMEQFKAKTGVDVRSISRIAASVRLMNPERVSQRMDKKDFAVVVIAQGDFEAAKFIETMRREEKDKVREQTYNGQLIYTIDERPKGSTQTQAEIETPSVAALDANTIAIGDLLQMRATVDARTGTGRLSPDLLALATRNSNALVSVAGNIPPTLMSRIAPKDQKSGNEEMDRMSAKFFQSVSAIKQMYLSAGMTESGLEAQLGARFNTAEHAQSLGDMLLGARQMYGVFIEDKTIRDLVEKMQITAQGDEVQLRAEVPQVVIKAMLENAAKKEAAAAATSTAPAATATTAKPAQKATTTRKKTRRTTRRKRT
ncbi:MAG: hypothetical protein ICV68_14435, partial [Pyrinomonadaceae bacterium]|nr:hypothetical protein [Pyrinomonadaceae bacterium]